MEEKSVINSRKRPAQVNNVIKAKRKKKSSLTTKNPRKRRAQDNIQNEFKLKE